MQHVYSMLTSEAETVTERRDVERRERGLRPFIRDRAYCRAVPLVRPSWNNINRETTGHIRFARHTAKRRAMHLRAATATLTP